jgi:hypothetical protein
MRTTASVGSCSAASLNANDSIRWLLQCGISYLFDPDIEGAAKNGCTHMLRSPSLLIPCLLSFLLSFWQASRTAASTNLLTCS